MRVQSGQVQLFGSCLQASCLHSPEYLNEDYKGGVFLEFLGERSHLVKDLMQTHLAHTCFSEECFSIRFAVTWKATETRRMIAAHYGDRNRFRIREIRYYLSLLPFLFLVTSMFFVLVTHVFFFFLSLSLFVSLLFQQVAKNRTKVHVRGVDGSKQATCWKRWRR